MTICSLDAAETKTKALRTTLKESGYPEKFINKHLAMKIGYKECLTMSKMSLYTQIQFRGDPPGEMLIIKLRTAIQTIFNARKI